MKQDTAPTGRRPWAARLPRLLPMTIVMMAALLVVKSGAVVEAATNTTAASASTAANAAAAPAPPAAAARSEVVAPAGKDQAAMPSPLPGPAITAAPPGAAASEAELHLLTDLRQRRVELDKREAALSAREATIAAVDARLAARVSELTALQQKLEALEQERKDRDDASWRGLVKVYETMKPKDAAIIFNDLDLSVLLQVTDRMKEAKVAPILAAMLPERARQLTAELSQMRLKSNTLATQVSPASGPTSAKPTPKP